MFRWTIIRPLVVAWAFLGLLGGIGYALLTILWNDTLRDPQTILVLTAWLGGLFAVSSILCGFASVLPASVIKNRIKSGTRAETTPILSSYPQEIFYAAVTWTVAGPCLLLLDLEQIQTHYLVPFALGLAVALASLLRLFDEDNLPVNLLHVMSLACVILGGFLIALLIQEIYSRNPKEPDDQIPEIAVVPGHQVLLIGLDGADFRRIDALISAGRLPVIKRLMDQGFRSNLHTFEPTLSPIIWTSIATGMREDKHGIRGFTEVWLPGAGESIEGLVDPQLSPWIVQHIGSWMIRHDLLQQRPVTSEHRRVKAIWNILSEENLKVGVVNWFASWPSDEVNGYFVSDNNPWRAAFMDRRVGEQISSVEGVTWPPELLDELADLDMPTVGETKDEILELDIFSDLTEEERQEIRTGPQNSLNNIRTIYLSDVFAAHAGLELMRSKNLDFLAVYMSGIDNFSHRLGTLTGVVDRYYGHVDEVLGKFMALAHQNTTIIIVSDHGWEYQPGVLWGHDHAPDGILIMAGDSVVKTKMIERTPSVLDITPTLLAFYGLPPSSEMEGTAIVEPLEADVSMSIASMISSYGRYHPTEITESDTGQLERNEETLRKLRALGYIQ